MRDYIVSSGFCVSCRRKVVLLVEVKDTKRKQICCTCGAITRSNNAETLQPESWIEHSLRVARAIQDALEQRRYLAASLSVMLGVSEADVEIAVKLTGLLHDFGKLSIEWQSKAGVSDLASVNELLAHTKGRNYIDFPEHAVIGAYALWPALIKGNTLPQVLVKAACFCIADHHIPGSFEVPPYKLHPQWKTALEQVLKQCGLSGVFDLESVIAEQPAPTSLPEKPPQKNEKELYKTYILFLYWLKLANQ